MLSGSVWVLSAELPHKSSEDCLSKIVWRLSGYNCLKIVCKESSEDRLQRIFVCQMHRRSSGQWSNVDTRPKKCPARKLKKKNYPEVWSKFYHFRRSCGQNNSPVGVVCRLCPGIWRLSDAKRCYQTIFRWYGSSFSWASARRWFGPSAPHGTDNLIESDRLEIVWTHLQINPTNSPMEATRLL